jgi:acyl-CoA dehydrogenase
MATQRAAEIAARVEAFVRARIIPYESDPRRDHHGAPLDELVMKCAIWRGTPGF